MAPNYVSIPFKRESVSEHLNYASVRTSSGPVSIPFKRESVSEPKEGRAWIVALEKFQFPSNGKAYLNIKGRLPLIVKLQSFNSLQTGKRIWTEIFIMKKNKRALVSIPFKRESVSELLYISSWSKKDKTFQFPSNGKAYLNSNRIVEPHEKQRYISFNSLQTGKRIWTLSVAMKRLS